jgi:hypothetical protein
VNLFEFVPGSRKPDTVFAMSDEMKRIPKMLIKEKDTKSTTKMNSCAMDIEIIHKWILKY